MADAAVGAPASQSKALPGPRRLRRSSTLPIDPTSSQRQHEEDDRVTDNDSETQDEAQDEWASGATQPDEEEEEGGQAKPPSLLEDLLGDVSFASEHDDNEVLKKLLLLSTSGTFCIHCNVISHPFSSLPAALGTPFLASSSPPQVRVPKHHHYGSPCAHLPQTAAF